MVQSRTLITTGTDPNYPLAYDMGTGQHCPMMIRLWGEILPFEKEREIEREIESPLFKKLIRGYTSSIICNANFLLLCLTLPWNALCQKNLQQNTFIKTLWEPKPVIFLKLQAMNSTVLMKFLVIHSIVFINNP